MRMRLVILISTLIVVGSDHVAYAESCKESMSLEDAIELYRSGQINENTDPNLAERATELVKRDIKACLTYFEPDKCQGPAKAWVIKWAALQLPSSSSKPLVLRPPSLLQWHVPFTKSVVDFVASMPSPIAGNGM